MIVKALQNLAPTAQWSVTDGVLTWLDTEQSRPTDAAIQAEVAKLQAEYDAQEYARQREAEYPSIKELVVALYDTEDKAAIDAKRAEIKKKYPKGAS